MKDFFDTWKFKILVGIAVFLVGIMAYAGANGRLTAAPQELLSVAAAPFQKVAAVVSGGVASLWEKYTSIDDVMAENEALKVREAERADREIAGFLAATIAWGNRRAIVTSGHRMMRCMDDAPADFVRNASDRELATLETYVHRTFNGRDLRDFVLALRRMDRRFGGLGVFFEERYAAAQRDRKSVV